MSQSQSHLHARTNLHQFVETIPSLRRRFFGTYKLVTLICFVDVLILMLRLVLGKFNGFLFIIGVIGSFIQLHYLVLISTKSIAARCQNHWAGFVRMLGQRSVILNLSVIALCSSEGSVKFKVFIGFIAAIYEIVHVLWPLIPSYKTFVEPWEKYYAPILLFIGTCFVVLAFLFALYAPTFSFFGMCLKILLPLVISLPYMAFIEGHMECYDENCNCRIYSPLPTTSLSKESDRRVPYTYVKSMSHEKWKILDQEMSLGPALFSVIFSVTALAFLSMTAGYTIEDFSEKLYSPSSGTLIILFMVALLFQQITSITPKCLPMNMFILRVVYILPLNSMFATALWVSPMIDSLVDASVGQYIYVAFLLWSEAHEAFFSYYTCKNPAEWGKYVIMSFLLVIWTILLDV